MKKNWLTGRVTGFDPIPRLAHIFALALALFVAPGAWADITKDNPVTGDTETYINEFTGGTDGTATEWNDPANWNTGVKPFISGGNFNASLVYGKTATTTTQLEGWTPRIGAYNGAVVTFSGGINKIQNDSAKVWLTADETSTITIASFAGNQLENANAPFVQSSANASGITWTAGITSSSSSTLPFWYCLKGSGTVVYGGNLTIANPQIIKNADITLSGNATPSVESKTLVTFGSGTTATFTADAAIKVYDTDGTTLVETVNLATVNSTGATTLTTSAPVGSVELVQTSTGILLYYVDGTPASYTPSININFCYDSNSGLSTTDDIGYGAYAVPGGSWNNFTVADNYNTQTFGTVAAINSVGVASTVSGAGVTVSGQRGRYSCSLLTAASNLLYGYIDDGNDKTTPTVTITSIPYERYRVIVYAAADTANATFGYMTVNNINYTYVNGALKTGTSAWGSAGADKSANELSEGGNVLVSSVTSGSTATITGHRSSSNCRGNIAAVQIVEYTPTADDNDLLIELDGDKTHTFEEAKTYGTVYVTGSGTLTFNGTASIATTLDISGSAAVNMTGSTLTANTVTGTGTAIYTGATPPTGLGWADGSNWQGTLWVKNTTFTGVLPNTMANANSTLKLSGVVGYFNSTGNTQTSDGTLELENDSYSYAFSVSDGWSTGGITVFAKLKGSGTLGVQSKDIAQCYVFKDASEFTGTFNLAGRPLRVILGDGASLSPDEGTITVVSGTTATIPSGKTWTANKNGFRVEGTLNVNGTLASSAETAAIKGSGTVVFTGRAPTPTGDRWWKNTSWTGTVQMKDVTNLVGASNYSGTNFLPNDYGNTGSTLELYNCSGWLPNNNNYRCTVPLKVTGTLTINNGITGSKFVISHLSGTGAIYTDSNTATVTIQVLEAENFTGYVKLNSKRVIFGETIPKTFTSGQIYVGEGFTFTVPNSNAAWYGTGGITLAGELKATSLNNLGGGTTVTTTDTGVFTLINSNDTQDHSVDYARITGTGTLRYADVSGKWRSLSQTNFPTGMICENNLSTGLILTKQNDSHTIGSLAGSGQMRSDWGGSGSSNDRDLHILQAKDTVYSGLFANTNDRVKDVYIEPGASTAGTLTLSGTQTARNGLIVESGAKVNLTGTWVGDTTVSGTFGGTGTLTGDLTFSDGATFKAFATDADGLSVSGTVTCPAEGTVTLDVSDLTLTADVALLTASDLNKDKFTLKGAPENSTLEVVEGVLTLKLPVTITVPSVANATATATIGDTPIVLANGQAAVPAGSVVTVTYTANEGYELSGTAQYTIDTASATTFAITDTATVEYVASITVGDVTIRYTSLQKAISEATSGQSVTLLADVALTSTITIDKDLTLDLNGKNVTATNCRALYVSAGIINVTGSGTISTVVTEGTSFSASSSVIRVGGDTEAASFTLGKNVTVSTDYCYGITYFGQAAQTVVIDGTVSVTGKQPALSGNGNSWNAEVALTVNGTVSAEDAYAIYNPQKGTTVINGTVTGVGGIEVKAGAVTVNKDAKITATGTPSYTQSNQDGTSTVGYAIASVGNASYANNATVTITGGTITGTTITIAENGATAGGVVTATSNSVIVPAGYEWVKTGGIYTLKAVVGTTFTVY